MTKVRFIWIDRRFPRLDSRLAQEWPDLSRSEIQRLISTGAVIVNGKPITKKGMPLKPGDRVGVDIEIPVKPDPTNLSVPLDFLHQDPQILVLDKPAGLVVHPSAGGSQATVVSSLVSMNFDLSNLGGNLRPGIVHRLDKETSGVMVIARTDVAHEHLNRQFREREVRKVYLALVRGQLKPDRGLIEAPIARHPVKRKRMAVVQGGKEASTGYQVVAHVANHTLLEAYPETGRTHQVRVHLAAIGFPIAGDRLYGGPSPYIQRPFLHALLLGFRLPGADEYREFIAPPPLDLSDALHSLAGMEGEQALKEVPSLATRG